MGQIRQFTEYKLKDRGKLMVRVKPHYSSQECSRCGHIEKGNRPSQSVVKCLSCDFAANTDDNASQRLSVLSTYNAAHSAYLIAKLASLSTDGQLSRKLARRSEKPGALFDQKRYVLKSLPGISKVKAEALLTKFGSIKNISITTVDELADVKGIGPGDSKDIVRVFDNL